MMQWIDGKKVYVGALALILVGVAELMKYDVVPSVTPENAIDTIFAGFLLLSGRSALKKLEK